MKWIGNSPSLACRVVLWCVGLFGRLDLPYDYLFLPLGKGVVDDGGEWCWEWVWSVGLPGLPGWSRDHILASAWLTTWPLCILVHLTGDPSTCFYPFVNSMINFTNMYIITFVHYIGIFFLFLVSTRCVNTNIYNIYTWLNQKLWPLCIV